MTPGVADQLDPNDNAVAGGQGTRILRVRRLNLDRSLVHSGGLRSAWPSLPPLTPQWNMNGRSN